jgi:hypothetical protein
MTVVIGKLGEPSSLLDDEIAETNASTLTIRVQAGPIAIISTMCGIASSVTKRKKFFLKSVYLSLEYIDCNFGYRYQDDNE